MNRQAEGSDISHTLETPTSISEVEQRLKTDYLERQYFVTGAFPRPVLWHLQSNLKRTCSNLLCKYNNLLTARS